MARSQAVSRLEKAMEKLRETEAAEREALAEIGRIFLDTAEGRGKYARLASHTVTDLRDALYGAPRTHTPVDQVSGSDDPS